MRHSEQQTTDLAAEFLGKNPTMGDVHYECVTGRFYVYAMSAVGNPCAKIGVTTDIDRRRDQISGPLTMEVRFTRDFASRAAAMFFYRRIRAKLIALEIGPGWFLACEMQVLEAVRQIDRSVQ